MMAYAGEANPPSRERRCFAVPRRQLAQPCTAVLAPRAAEALAGLLPLLGCGEEAAVLGFDRLSGRTALDQAARQAMHAIAVDERVHDALLRGLEAALPAVRPDRAALRAARRFHASLDAGDDALHLARIAGLDAAVCTILSRLLRPGRPLSGDRQVTAMLGHIRRDETRHVAVSRRIASAAMPAARARDAAAEARSGLAALLTHGCAHFEALAVDPDRLVRDIRTVPDGLFAG